MPITGEELFALCKSQNEQLEALYAVMAIQFERLQRCEKALGSGEPEKAAEYFHQYKRPSNESWPEWLKEAIEAQGKKTLQVMNLELEVKGQHVALGLKMCHFDCLNSVDLIHADAGSATVKLTPVVNALPKE